LRDPISPKGEGRYKFALEHIQGKSCMFTFVNKKVPSRYVF